MLEEALPSLVARVGNGDDRLMTHLRRSHSSAADAGRIARAAEVGGLALHHLIPSDDPAWTEAHWRAAVAPHWGGRLYLGQDGMVIDV
jgi:ribonuclease BN (tRNA processing enzyme)